MTKPTPDIDQDPLWEQARNAVATHAERLRTLTEHGHLYGWAVLHGLSGPQLWPRVKHELRDQLGIDFDHLRATTHAARRAAIAQADNGPHLRLWAAGNSTRQSFAVCGPRGVLWYNNLTIDDWWYHGDQATAELSAAHRATWLAGRARTLAGIGAARLTLHLNTPGIHTDLLTGTAERARVALTVEPVAADDNPAVTWCLEPGWRSCTDLPEFIAATEDNTSPTDQNMPGDSAESSQHTSAATEGGVR
ncbi:hypothetical protein D5S18_07905 [Nocardia panacis]|uniref:Uncharacterized protein n=1 Tax=Nocardia panacis TaxID=2340916 RepID=A0A3A4KFA8_9NOCA|nr:hypothetical protein [Nocardia panacis]RJO77649.1 hypothetical protein D5S18_07905 [Nocardia panacis]